MTEVFSKTKETHDLENVLEGLHVAAEECGEELTAGHVLGAFAERSFGALLTVIALVAALPVIGAIPGVSILTGSLIILVAAQYLAGRDALWFPQRFRELSIRADAMKSAVAKARPYAAKIDSVIQPRLTALTKGPVATTTIALGAIALAALFYPAALIPGGVWPPALSVMALGLALLGNDGALAVVGAAGAAATVALLLWLL